MCVVSWLQVWSNGGIAGEVLCVKTCVMLCVMLCVKTCMQDMHEDMCVDVCDPMYEATCAVVCATQSRAAVCSTASSRLAAGAIPRDTYRLLLEVWVDGHECEEFWYMRPSGYSCKGTIQRNPYREVGRLCVVPMLVLKPFLPTCPQLQRHRPTQPVQRGEPVVCGAHTCYLPTHLPAWQLPTYPQLQRSKHPAQPVQTGEPFLPAYLPYGFSTWLQHSSFAAYTAPASCCGARLTVVQLCVFEEDRAYSN
jgi:hypothetical protein